jgi:hypothetical protein
LQLKKPELIEKISSDLDHAYRLAEAYRARRTPKKPMSEILPNVVPPAGGAAGEPRRRQGASPGRERPVGYSRIDNASLLLGDERCASALGINLEVTIERASDELLRQWDDRRKAVSWLSNMPVYYSGPIDLGTRCKAAVNYFVENTKSLELQGNAEHSVILRTLIDHLQNRTWLIAATHNNLTPARVYEFLRWALRLELVLLGTNASRLANSSRVHSDSLSPSVSENLLVDLVRLEKYVGRKSVSFGAIRLVKYQTG